MNRDVTFGIAALSLVLFACGGSNKEAKGGDDEVVGWTKTMEEDDAKQLVPVFAKAARKHGCTTKEEDNHAVAKCDDGTIVVLRQGPKITVACKGVTQQQCSQLFSNIADELKK